MSPPKTPLVAVDIVIELLDRPNRPIVLIERKHEPLGWALPGGFVDLGESAESAAIREAAEETNVSVELVTLLGVYSDPRRDPRGHTVSIVYVATGRGELTAMDDAVAIRPFGLDELPSALAFDHTKILRDYRTYRESGKLPPPAQPGPSLPAA